MKIIRYLQGVSSKRLFERYELNPSNETVLFLFPGVSAVQETEDGYCGKGVWGKNLLTFSELTDFVNETSPNLKRKKISATQVFSVIRKATETLSEKLEVLGEFSANRDFLGGMVSIIARLKRRDINPAELSRISRKVKGAGLRKKLKDIGLVYEKYDALLSKKGFLDDADLLKAVSREIEREGLDAFFPPADKLAIFGFSDFTKLELNVIKSLSSSLSETFLFVSDFHDLKEYESHFLDSLEKSSIVYEKEPCDEKDAETGKAKREFREFADSHDEIEYIAKKIKKLIADEGFSARDFKVLVKSSQNRGRSIARTFEKNGVAVNLRNSGTLAGSIYGTLARDVLRLKSGNFHRNDLIRFLRHPLFVLYLGGAKQAYECIGEIRKLSSAESQDHRTISGIAGWKRILEHVRKEKNHLSDVARNAGTALELVSSKFGKKSFSALTSDLREVFSALRVSENSAELIERGDMTRECFDGFFSFLLELSFIYGEFDCAVADVREYLFFVEEFMSRKSLPYKTPCESDLERVDVIGFQAAGGINPRVLFLAGLSDVSFPSPLPADSILKTREKAEINAALGNSVFEEEGFHYEKEKHLFFELASAASEKAVFSWFRRDHGLKEVNRSEFLGETEGFAEQEAREESSGPGEVFSAEDILRLGFSSGGDAPLEPRIRQACRAEYGFDLAECLLRGVDAERKRLNPYGPYTVFEGVLSKAIPMPEAFSPTRLEDYGACPFRYFSKRILKLAFYGDPEESRASQLDLGGLAHRILKELMETVFVEGRGFPDPEHVLEAYKKISVKHRAIPGGFSHLPGTVAEMEKRRFFDHVLPGFISEEMGRIEKSGFVPRFFEKKVKFHVGENEISGKIDRVDIVEDEEKAASVIDYKIGRVESRKISDFKNLQLPLYLKALSEQGYLPAACSYVSIGKPGENIQDGKPAVDAAVSLSEYYMENIKNGFFPPFTEKKEEGQLEHAISADFNKHPCSYCDYADLCRVKDGVVRKTGPAESE